MKKLILFIIFGILFFPLTINSQNVAINSAGTTAVASAMLDVASTTSGLLLPRMTAAQRIAIAAPATGLIVYQTDAGTLGIGFYFYNGAAWVPWGTNNGDWGLSGNTGTVAATNFIGTTDAIDWVVRTNNTERMRILSAGNILFNRTTALFATDLIEAQGTATFPDPINSYTSVANATGIYGESTNGAGTGVAGVASGAGAGIGVFGIGTTGTGTGVYGWNNTAAGAAVGFGGYFTNSQTGGAGLAGSLGSSTYFAKSGISGFTLNTIAGGFGAIASCDNATGIGVQGQTAGAGAALGIAGIASGANRNAIGIYGTSSNSGTSGTSFTIANCRKSIYGQGSGAVGNFYFGMYGDGGVSTRSGGVIGNDANFAWGALGYRSSTPADIAVYGFGLAYTVGGAGGMIEQPNDGSLYASLSYGGQKSYKENNMLNSLTRDISLRSVNDVDISTWSNIGPNSMIGLGIYGGVMGGWIKGLVYGANLSGAKYGAYVHGKTITNNIIATLNNVDGSDKRVATFASTSMKVEVTNKGKAKLNNGRSTISFDKNFAGMVSSEEPVIITVTPLGSSKGLYIEQTSTNEFTVVENDGGNSNVEFNWIAIAVKKGFENPQISPEILANDFEEKMNGDKGIMYNDNNPAQPDYHLWYDGKQVRFDMPPNADHSVFAPLVKEQTPLKLDPKKVSKQK